MKRRNVGNVSASLVTTILVILVLVSISAPTSGSAEVFRILNHGAAATGQGSAFAAQADDPSAIYFNPAGITQLQGVQFYGGLSLFGGSVSFQNPAGATVRGDLGGSVAWPPPAHFYITANLGDLGWRPLEGLSVGLGVTTPYGLDVRYPSNGPFSTAVTEAKLPLLDVKPTLAYRLTEALAFGIGADIYTFADFIGGGQLELKSAWPGGGGIPAGTPIEVNGNDTAAGFNVSMLYTPYRNDAGKPLVNIGFQYRSQATLQLRGQFLANGGLVADTRSSLVLPQIFTGAIAVWPIRDARHEWKLEIDVDHVGWKSNRNLNVDLSTGGTLPFPQDWRNNFVFYTGTEYRWLQLERLPNWEVALRGGYWHSQTPVPDATFNPAVPDSDHHNISVGAGLLCKQHGLFLGLIPCGSTFNMAALGLDVSYQTLIYETRTISGNINPTVNGTYQTVLHMGSVSLRVIF